MEFLGLIEGYLLTDYGFYALVGAGLVPAAKLFTKIPIPVTKWNAPVYVLGGWLVGSIVGTAMGQEALAFCCGAGWPFTIKSAAAGGSFATIAFKKEMRDRLIQGSDEFKARELAAQEAEDTQEAEE